MRDDSPQPPATPGDPHAPADGPSRSPPATPTAEPGEPAEREAARARPTDGAQEPAAPERPTESEQELPALDFQPLAEGWVPSELVGWRIFLGVVCLAAAGVAVWQSIEARLGWPAALGIGPAAGLVLYLVLMALAKALVRRQFAAASWAVDDTHLRLRRGVWWRKEVLVPRSRVQHTDVTQGPVQRAYGVATLVVHTAGTAYSTVSLEGLTHERARELRDRLVLAGGDDGV